MTEPLLATEAETARKARQTRIEILLVLGLSFGRSAVRAIVDLLNTATSQGGLAGATTTLNPTQAPGRPWFDLAYNLVDIFFGLVPAFLAIHLLARDHLSVRALFGLDRTRRGPDALTGVGLAALIGIPGIGLYVLGRHLGIGVQVVATDLPKIWWEIPVLILSAIQNGISEEVVVVGYLTTRLTELKWRLPAVIVASALLRGSYHLYQGIGAFFGNAAMGVVFAYFYRRFGRVLPLIIAHSILDIITFVGYALFAKYIPFLH